MIDKLRMYYISMKPGISYFVGLTAFASAYLGSKDFYEDSLKILMVSLGVIVSAGGSALINNLLDRDIDRLMDRTKDRPTAKGEIDPKEGYTVATIMILLGISSVYIFGGVIPALLDALAVLSYDVIYTLFLKRKDPFGVILGGIPGALPTLIGYYSTSGRVDMIALLLFAFMFLWQPPHFWALAIKYKQDYIKGRLPVMPIIYGDTYTKLQALLYSFSLIPLILLPPLLGLVNLGFVTITLPPSLIFVFLHIRSLKGDVDLKKIFLFSNLLLLFFFAGLVIFR